MIDKKQKHSKDALSACYVDPDFVSSYEIDDYVYFFFRETAIEYINCGKVRH